MNYTQPDKPYYEDKPEDWLFAARCFASALGHIFEDGEGIIIKMDGEMYMIGRRGKQIGCLNTTDAEFDNPEDCQEGVWYFENDKVN